jgi:hypothetical protein
MIPLNPWNGCREDLVHCWSSVEPGTAATRHHSGWPRLLSLGRRAYCRGETDLHIRAELL